MRNYLVWRRELISEISTIANRDELRRLWSGADPHAISSFAEEVAHVFDDFDIDGFIAAGPELASLNSTQFDALREFRNRFAAYIDEQVRGSFATFDYEAVLDDPKWIDVTLAARKFIDLLGAEAQ